MTFKPEHIQNIQGKDHVKYPGLLDKAHEMGLKGIRVTVIQVPHADNGNTAICVAEAEMPDGVYCDVGDASPGNVGRMIVPHILRMASTRAKARALRDAINVGEAAAEEFGETDDRSESKAEHAVKPHADFSNEPGDPFEGRAPVDSRELNTPNGQAPASANQLATVAKLSRLTGQPEPASESMTKEEAQALITRLSALYNERGRPQMDGPAKQEPKTETKDTRDEAKAKTEELLNRLADQEDKSVSELYTTALNEAHVDRTQPMGAGDFELVAAQLEKRLKAVEI